MRKIYLGPAFSFFLKTSRAKPQHYSGVSQQRSSHSHNHRKNHELTTHSLAVMNHRIQVLCYPPSCVAASSSSSNHTPYHSPSQLTRSCRIFLYRSTLHGAISSFSSFSGLCSFCVNTASVICHYNRREVLMREQKYGEMRWAWMRSWWVRWKRIVSRSS